MAIRKYLQVFVLCLFALSTGAYAQRVTDSGFGTIAFIKSDGTIQDSGFKVIGHFKENGTIQDSSFRVIGHADGIPMRWAAWFFFFRD